MQKKSQQVALGGIATALCIVLMFATGMIPFSYYALPALAGLVLIGAGYLLLRLGRAGR